MANKRSAQEVGNAINFTPAPDDQFHQCPYNKSHMVLRSNLLFHLNKCRENYKEEMKKKKLPVDIGICRFNCSHHIPAMNIKYHEENCPDAAQVVEHVIKLNTPNAFVVPAVVNTGAEGLDSTEDWDEDVRIEGPRGYDPKLKLEREVGNIIQALPGHSTKSQRKKFRDEQAEQFKRRGGFEED